MRIAYIMSRFPHLPETFILREMNEMEAQGCQVELYPLVSQGQPVVHEAARPWLGRAHRFPLISRPVITTNWRTLWRRPLLYLTLWLRLVRENGRSPGFLGRALYLFPKAVAAAAQMQTEQVDHIHAHYATHPALLAWLIHQLTNIPYSVTVHAHDIFVNTTMLATKLRDAAFVIAISEFNRDYLVRLLGDWVRPKTVVIHCGIEPEQYGRPVRSTRPPPCLEILSIGSLQPYKGFPYLIAACADLRAAGIPFRCRLVGDGEERLHLTQLIAEHSLQEQVLLLGAKTETEVIDLLTAADCYVQPSIVTASGKMEGIPVALMEALAAGVPVIASNLSGIPELVRPRQTGYLVPPGDAEALAAAVIHLYNHPREAIALAEAGRILVQAEFNLGENVGRLMALLMAAHREPQSAWAGVVDR
jgi:colanic acid/amylovoran biosynthesis glycosyltransferase